MSKCSSTKSLSSPLAVVARAVASASSDSTTGSGSVSDVISGMEPRENNIADDNLAQMTVKELNKRVQNLSRDQVVALKQRRRTLKNRG